MDKIDAKLLVVDDDQDVLLAAKLFLKQHFAIVHTEKDPKNISNLLANENYDIILLDMNFSKDATSGKEGFHWLNIILEIDPAAVVIFITGYGDIELAVQGIKEGATNFLLKPWVNKKLLATITANLKVRESKKELEDLRTKQKVLIADQNQSYREIIGSSHSMQQVLQAAQKVAITDANVLILGENGTGKEMVAREIHRQSSRSTEAFINVDLGAIHENLFESELFGHKKGAFTGALESKPGRFEAATGGTLFLDEIGNLSLSLQSKLLSALQNRKITRIGSNKEIPVDIRLISATNMPLYEMVQKNEFREDLLYRINMVEIRVPPLRERIKDIPLLVEYFFDFYTKKYRKVKLKIQQSTINSLSKYTWPGNIRELKHSVERAVILCEGNNLNYSDFAIESSSVQLDPADGLNLKDMEKRYILKAIHKNNGNITHAARDLGIARTALYRRLRKHGL